jgi:hypothetical protein
MSCRIRARQCISATVDHNYEPRGVKTYAIFGSDRPFRCTFCDPRLSAHAVGDRWIALPAPADLLGLYGRSDRAARALGGGRDGNCPGSALPPLGHRRVRSGAKNLAKPRALVAPLDLCRARRGRKRQWIGPILVFSHDLNSKSQHHFLDHSLGDFARHRRSYNFWNQTKSKLAQ